MKDKIALSLVKVDPPLQKESEWNKWYNNKHIAERLVVPGVLAIGRFAILPEMFTTTGETKYITLYYFKDIRVLKSEAYRKLRTEETSSPSDSFEVITSKLPRFNGGIYEETSLSGRFNQLSKFVLLVADEANIAGQEDFESWYTNTHIPAVLRSPEFICGRRFQLNENIPPLIRKEVPLPKSVTIYDIQSEDAIMSESFQKADIVLWRSWGGIFVRKMFAVYKRIFPE